MKKHRILLVDDHPVFRFGLSKLINEEDDLEVCAETDNAASAIQIIESLSPALVVVDITLNGRNGIDLLKQIHSNWPALLLLVVSMHDEDLYAQRVYRAGAKGYVQKDRDPESIVTAIHHLLNGKHYWREEPVNCFSENSDNDEGVTMQSITKLLADREYEIFCLMGQGFRPKQIAERLMLSVHTVENHRSKIRQKLNLDDSKQLVRLAYEMTNNFTP